MKSKRVYLSCQECHVRCRKAKEKRVSGYDMNQNAVHEVEYECPNCGRMYLWDYYTNIIRRGSFANRPSRDVGEALRIAEKELRKEEKSSRITRISRAKSGKIPEKP